jgi:trans-2,3-dihydro-3-hydroxyanthranilate isomerase
MPRRYAILDVFADRPLAGNPLAVVMDADGLETARMQAIAREFNLSETVFVLPPDNRMHSARIRIFTPAAELPFAGHPTVGTAVMLALEKVAGAAGRHEMVLVVEEEIGAVRCGVFVAEAGAGHAIFDAPRLPEAIAVRLDRDLLAVALGLSPAEIGFENHQPSAFSAGLAYGFVPVRNIEVIARAAPNVPAWDAAFAATAGAAYLYCRETEAVDRQFHARMFASGPGMTEDPATGSAAAAFAGVVKRFDEPTAGGHRVVIEQGFEIGRPSLMTLEFDVEDGDLSAVRVGGDAVVVAEGMLDV